MSEFGVQIGPQNRPKIVTFQVQEASYLTIAKNVKMCFPPQRGLHVCLTQGAQEPSMLKCMLSALWKPLPEPPEAL